MGCAFLFWRTSPFPRYILQRKAANDEEPWAHSSQKVSHKSYLRHCMSPNHEAVTYEQIQYLTILSLLDVVQVVPLGYEHRTCFYSSTDFKKLKAQPTHSKFVWSVPGWSCFSNRFFPESKKNCNRYRCELQGFLLKECTQLQNQGPESNVVK